MKRTISIALLAACAFATSALAAEIPVEKVKEKVRTCAACHGEDGNATANAMYPRLAGQYHDYLARALHEYKSGERKNPIMAGFAATLSEAEIQALASYFASLPGKLDDLSRHEQGN
ncbi:MAG TPA: cytochrome c [Rudaea sp.]|nr:cytochrome c [Rudaea sp.]